MDVMGSVSVLTACFFVWFPAVTSESQSVNGRCEVYNGTACSEFLQNKKIFVFADKSFAKQEKKLRKWFRRNQQSRQISHECWKHAKVLTCHKFYPGCSSNEEADTRPLCPRSCNYVKEICRNEYKRTLHSKHFQQYFPFCSSVQLNEKNSCWNLPTYNPQEGPVLYAEGTKYTRKKAGDSVALKCFFSIKNFLWSDKNVGMVREGTWLRKDGRRIRPSRKFSFRTNNKGRARLLMTLRIRDVEVKDSGLYHCEVTFGDQTAQGSARLKVFRSKLIPVIVPKGSTGQQQKTMVDSNEKKNGKCVKYSGKICSAYLGRGLVFEKKTHPLDKLNAQLLNVIKNLKSTKKLSKRCEEFGEAVICHHKFPKCNAANNTGPVHRLCKSDCLRFHQEYCQEELSMVHTDELTMFIPKCELLPENEENCSRISNVYGTKLSEISKKNQIHPEVDEAVSCYDEDSDQNYVGTLSIAQNNKFCDRWSDYERYKSIKHDHCRNFGESKPWCYASNKKTYCNIKSCHDVMCYKGRGEEYQGKMSVSKSGKKCLQWNKLTMRYSNVDNTFCRNFEGDMEGPWCFVDNKKTKELCDIPRCLESSAQHQPVPIVKYVVPSIVGVSVLLFSAFLLVFYWKNKKLSGEKHSVEEVLDLRDEEERAVDEFPKMNTLSKNASHYNNKDLQSFKGSLVLHAMFQYSPAQDSKKYKQNVPEVKEECFQNLVKIGDGNLGQLWQADFQCDSNHFMPVLLRKLKPDTRSCLISSFREEMKIMQRLRHRNIEQIVCVSAMSEIPFMAFSGSQKIDLKEFIQADKAMTSDFLVDCIYQISNGLCYLHKQKVLHRDLAARNCFISSNGTVYISKSGLGMYRYPDDYVNIPEHGLCPLRWLPPETLQTSVYRFSTDIYMLGILVWELFTRGGRPFSKLSDDEVIQKILDENTLTCPSSIPVDVQFILEQCWLNPEYERPSVNKIRELFYKVKDKNNNPVPS